MISDKIKKSPSFIADLNLLDFFSPIKEEEKKSKKRKNEKNDEENKKIKKE